MNVIDLNGYLYVIGGYDSKKVLDSVERYSPSDDKWTVVKSMNIPRFAHTAAVLNGKIYVIGGFYQLTMTVSGESPVLTSVECYDPDKDTWPMVRLFYYENRRLF